MTSAATSQSSWEAELLDLYRSEFVPLARQAERILHRRDLAEEAVQDAFVKYHVRRCCPKPGRQRAYLRTMVRNNAIALLRKHALSNRHEHLVDEPWACSAEVAVADHIADAELARLVVGLPTQQCRAITLRHIVGLSVSETARRMGISTGSVKTHTHRATETLRRQLIN